MAAKRTATATGALRLALTGVVCALLLVAGGVSFAAAKTVKASFVLLCDIYEMDAVKGRGGLGRVAAMVEAERRRAKDAGAHLFVAHAGDAISPSLMSGFDLGAHMIDLLNRLGLDAFVPGNHEFDFGADVFRKRMQEATFPLYGANLRDGEGKLLKGFRDGQIFDFSGVGIGVFGLTDEESASKSEPGNLKFAGVVETAKTIAGQLREQGADIVIAISHTGRAFDWQLVETGAIDLLLSGDDHDLLVYNNGNTAYVEAGQEGEQVVAVDLEIELTGEGSGRIVTWRPRFRILDSADFSPDALMEARINEHKRELAAELEAPLGSINAPLDSRTVTLRAGEAAIGNLVADAMRAQTGADIALINGGGIRGNKLYPAGHVMTRRDVLTELPFRNITVVYELTGVQVKAALENGLSRLPKEAGRFLQVSGLRLEADPARPAGERLGKVLVGGEPLRDKRRYKVATNDYMASGREDYGMFAAGRVLVGPTEGQMVSNDVMVHVRKAGTLSPAVEGRIVFVAAVPQAEAAAARDENKTKDSKETREAKESKAKSTARKGVKSSPKRQ